MPDSRYSIVVTRDLYDGKYAVCVTDYKTGRSCKSMLWGTAASAKEEGQRIVDSWRYGVLSQGAAAGGGA
jgi:hypothetical protein